MNQPQITPGENGYLPMLEQRDWKNPWAGLAGQDQGAVVSGVRTGQQSLADMTKQLASEYPTFQNTLGVGSQEPFPVPAEGGNLGLNLGASSAPAQASSPGFNPWSIQGEANAR